MQCEVAGLRQTFSFSLFISIWTDSESSARRNCIIGKYWVESCLLLVSNRFRKFHYWRLGSSKWLTVALWIILTTFQITGSKFCWTVSRCGFQALSGWTPGPSKHTRISRCVLLPSGVLGGWLLFCGIGSPKAVYCLNVCSHPHDSCMRSRGVSFQLAFGDAKWM